MSRVFLVRHGESGWNRAELVQGQSPAAPGLTGSGLRQAAEAAGQLAATLPDTPALILASDLRRTMQTAAPIARALGGPVWLEPRLRERSCGMLEGQPLDQVSPAVTGVSARSVIDPDAVPAGGESVRQFYRRVTGLLALVCAGRWPDGLLSPGTVRSGGRPVVLVTHGGVVRVTRAWLAGLGPAEMVWGSVSNASVLELPTGGRSGKPAGTAGSPIFP